MSHFGNTYSKYYNLLYKDKDYIEEFQYINTAINEFSASHVIQNKSILDIGCGTGKHLKCFKDIGYVVSGIDLSENMLDEARRYLGAGAELLCAKAAEFNFDKKFDVITALFHVMSYQNETHELGKVFLNTASHLVSGGLFLFDFWYGPAVLSDPPAVRIKRLEDEEIKIIRITEPVMRYNENIVDVNFEVLIKNKKEHSFETLHELHEMRYLFLPEIKYFAEKANLTFIDSYKWLTKDPLSNKSWYGFVILRKL
jgi:SAM-dependent methyltransferase